MTNADPININIDTITHLKCVLKWYPPATLLNNVKVIEIITTGANIFKNKDNVINNTPVNNSSNIPIIQ